MARSRNLKPGYFTNELLGAGDPLAQLLYAGLWCLADASGTLEDRPARIKAEVFPHRPADVDALLGQLAAQGFVSRYQAGGWALLHLPKFTEHQKPHWSEKARYPPPGAPERSGARSPLLPLPSSLNPSTPPPPGRGEPERRRFLDRLESSADVCPCTGPHRGARQTLSGAGP